MNLLNLAEKHVTLRKVGNEYHGACPACGPGKSGPEKTDRFSVKPDKDQWFCRTCGHGDSVGFLRIFENMKCSEAHATLGRKCTSTTCPALGKCPQGDEPVTRTRQTLKPSTNNKPAAQIFYPSEARPTHELWQEKAGKLIDHAHVALLENPEQLAYLAHRGLPWEAVEKYQLGWLDKDFFRPRPSWGLPEECWDNNGKQKLLKINCGLVIPSFVAGKPHRLRIRIPLEDRKPNGPSYLEVQGSGDDKIILRPEARAVVVVESDLDALLIDWVAGDLVGALAVVSATAKPKQSTWAQLQAALAILLALDFEPRENERTGKHENPGGQAAQWWIKQFPRAERWPVPEGKDPGEFYQDHGGDLRAWITAGLPPACRIAATHPAKPTTPILVPKPSAPPKPPVRIEDEALTGTYSEAEAKDGTKLIIAEHRADKPVLLKRYPEHIFFDYKEMGILKGRVEEAAFVLIFKQVIPTATVLSIKVLVEQNTLDFGAPRPEVCR